MKTRIQGRKRRVTVCCDHGHFVWNRRTNVSDYIGPSAFVPIPQLMHDDGRMHHYTEKEIAITRKRRDQEKRKIRQAKREKQRLRKLYGTL